MEGSDEEDCDKAGGRRDVTRTVMVFMAITEPLTGQSWSDSRGSVLPHIIVPLGGGVGHAQPNPLEAFQSSAHWSACGMALCARTCA